MFLQPGSFRSSFLCACSSGASRGLGFAISLAHISPRWEPAMADSCRKFQPWWTSCLGISRGNLTGFLSGYISSHESRTSYWGCHRESGASGLENGEGWGGGQRRDLLHGQDFWSLDNCLPGRHTDARRRCEPAQGACFQGTPTLLALSSRWQGGGSISQHHKYASQADEQSFLKSPSSCPPRRCAGKRYESR